MFFLIAAILFAYLLGSIPTAVWLGRLLKGIDLREHGSGNAGATNAFRVLGTPIGIAVFILDMAKGYVAVSLSHLQGHIQPDSEAWMVLRVGLGLMSVTGHIFPVFAGFKGGKGVSTMAGIGLALHPWASLCALAVYAIVFLVRRVSSVGSLAAVLSYPVWMILIFQTQFRSLWAFSIIVPILVIITHRSNIKRLFQGKES